MNFERKTVQRLFGSNFMQRVVKPHFFVHGPPLTMAKTKSIQPQTLPKSVSKARKSKPKTKEIEPTQEPVTKKVDEGSGSDSEEEDDCDEDDINEAGMKRIIELLGDDGLDRFAQYQLEVLGEQGSEEENDEIESGEGYSDVQDDNESENEAPISPSKEGEATGDDEDEDLDVTQDVLEAEADIEDLSEVDGDAVLRQQLEYMNTVRAFISVAGSGLKLLYPGCHGANTGKH